MRMDALMKLSETSATEKLPSAATRRRYPIGSEATSEGTHFRVWAPRRSRVAVVIESGSGSKPIEVPLAGEAEGYFSGTAAGIGVGTKYRFRLDDETKLFPDPASRFQPLGPHGPSQVVDPSAFVWTDAAWPGVRRTGQVIYELHIGTFTPEGTWAAAETKLPQLADLGITTIEVMPVSDFSGDFGWGYDGVNLFAPTRLYGTPDDFRRFVDRAHALGMGVILDVVYNHLGPDGNYLPMFSADYFTDRYKTDWGEPLNFDGPNSASVREYILTNAAYWIDEFHLDGLRLDATQNIYDASPRHVLAEIGIVARRAAGKRSIYLVAENEPQEAQLVEPLDDGGYGLDSLWNDDLHHSAHVALTGHAEAYYTDYRGRPQEFISALKWGYLYQGQWYRWQKQRRGTPTLKVDRACFVSFIENHDQVANSGRGVRLHQLANPCQYRAMTALMLLAPATPMLFQGQEFASSAPFLFFASHHPDLAKLVLAGRKKFLSQFPSLATPEAQAMVDDPAAPETFQRCRLDWYEWDANAAAVALHRDLIHLRRDDPVLFQDDVRLDGAVLNDSAFVLRFFAAEPTVGDRLLLINFGRDLPLSPMPEPLLADPAGLRWRLAWSSEDPRYGGMGTRPPTLDADWVLSGESALFFTSAKEERR